MNDKIALILDGVGQVGTARFLGANNVRLYSKAGKLVGNGLHSMSVYHACTSSDRDIYMTDANTYQSADLGFETYAVRLLLSVQTGASFSWFGDVDYKVEYAFISIR